MQGTRERFEAMGRACRCRDAAMAHRRPLVRGGAVRALGFGGLIVLAVACSVLVSAEVTRLRALAGDLEDRRICLEAEAADLARRWAEATGPAMVIARAERELGLVMPAQPDFVLVAARGDGAAGDGFLRRMLAGLGGGATANAAQPPVFVDGAMVSLDPAREPAAKGDHR